MNDRHTGRLVAPLESQLTPVLDTPSLERVRHSLAVGDVTLAPHGTVLVYATGQRRLVEIDRHGTLLAALRWSAASLDAAWLRLPDHSWLRIEPRATRDAPWGWSDRVWHGTDLAATDTALTVFESLDYLRLERIPTLAEPARLPPAAGDTVLNLVAAVAADQGRTTLTYRGPYPGEQLFLTLLECFHFDTSIDDPVAAFTAGTLGWRPAPHERVFAGDGVYLQLRDRVEKVLWRRRAYYRPDWQGVRRFAPRRVRDVGDGARCSLWALGAVLEDQLVLEANGEVRGEVASPPSPSDVRSLPAAAVAAIGHLVVAASAAPLGPVIATTARDLALEWGPVDGDLIEIGAHTARVSSRIRERLRELLGAAVSRTARAAVGLATLTEVAHLLGDELRSRAQERLAAWPIPDQYARLDAPAEPSAGAARDIIDGVEALLADVTT